MRSHPSRGLAVALAAVGVLAATGQPQWQDVIRNLRHPEAGARLAAVERLGRANYAAAIEPLAPLLGDPDDRVQAAALEAELTFFLTDRLSDRRILGFGGTRSRAQQAFDAGPLLRSATPAPPALVEALIAAIRDENARVRFDAVHALGFIAETPLPAVTLAAIAAELDHYDPIIRAATARVLGRLGQREAGDRLMAALDDSSETVRTFAAEALGLVREDRARTRLRDLVARASGRSTDALILALARIGAPDDAPLFREQLTSRSAGARRAGAEGLGRIGDRASLDALEQLASADRGADVRLAAAFALHRLGQPQSHVIASMLARDELMTQARDYLLEIGGDALPGVVEALRVATDPRHRADLTQMIGYIGTADALAVVEPLLRDPNDRVARAATVATLRLKRAS